MSFALGQIFPGWIGVQFNLRQVVGSVLHGVRDTIIFKQYAFPVARNCSDCDCDCDCGGPGDRGDGDGSYCPLFICIEISRLCGVGICYDTSFVDISTLDP